MKPPIPNAVIRTSRGLTILEFIVAMVILGIAMAGMYPLVATMSRITRPLRDTTDPSKLTYVSPARDWEFNTVNAAHEKRHTWYLLPFGEPWARKLGASTRIYHDEYPYSSPPSAFTGYSPTSIEPREIGPVYPNAGAPGYVESGANWQSPSTTHHYHDVLESASSEDCHVVWTFTVSTAGWYWIQAGWPSNSGLTLTTLGYTIAPAIAAQPNPISVDQSAVTPRIQEGSTEYYWYNLSAKPVYIAAGSLTVRLDVPKNDLLLGKQVIAAGVRLVQNSVTIDSLTRTPNSETVSAGVSVDVKVPK